MAGSVQDALAGVAVQLETLKAAVSQKQLAGEDAQQSVAAIRALTQELQALLQPQQECAAPARADGHARGPEAAGPGPAQRTAPKAALPSTPFDQRRPSGAGPATATKAPALTPGGMPATTPLAAEVLASLNNLGPGAAVRALQQAAPAAIDKADGDAAATLSGLCSGSLDLPPVKYPAQRKRQTQPSPALAALLQDTRLLPSSSGPTHKAAMAAAAAAAAGPALLPPPRRAASSLPVAEQADQRERRPCNCKRSMCLKMYCECFAAGGFCALTCACANCSNTPVELEAVTAARAVVLAKNPRAFEVKVTAADGHKKGCRCRRSKCLKKYCECFHAGARCNPDVCQCEDCRNMEGGDAFLANLGLCGGAPAPAASWADPSADVLAVFQAMAAPAAGRPTRADAFGSPGSKRSGRSRAAQLPLLPPMPSSFAFPLPPLPEAAGSDSLPASGLFAAPPLPPLDPAAFLAHQAAGFEAAGSLGGQQQPAVEESMAEAVSWPLPAAASQPVAPHAAVAGTPGGARVASALTSHLSDVAGAACESEIHDTATSPAPLMAIAKLAARNGLGPAMGPTLTGGDRSGRPPLPSSRGRSRAASPLSQGSAEENESLNTSGSQRGKRPRRAASGGVLGAVAAEAEWATAAQAASPPLKRANSLPVGVDAAKRGGKVSDRVALLKRALASETAAAAAAQHTLGVLPRCADAGAPSAEDADAVSALFELSSSVC